MNMAKNVILYGPPGTGKTYRLQSLMNKYIDYIIDDKQIVNAYHKDSKDWILITLILLQKNGRMKTAEIQSKIDSLILGVSINAAYVLDKHNILPAPIPAAVREQPRIFKNMNTNEWYVDFFRVQQTRPDFVKTFIDSAKISKRYNFVTFHQSYSYEDFIEGIRPEYVKATNSIDYSPKPGVFKLMCEEAEQHPEKEYAFFIDEINRGNISEIFGELISLIELDKRSGETGALSAVLPYSKTVFTVPSNISIYGTMNTADRSIDQIDIALRRRFKFEPMLPDADIIASELELSSIDANNIEGVDLIKLFNTLNNRIELLLDSQHLLGHALFIGVKNADDIANVIRNSVIPLLEEYFFDDIQKIQLVFNDLNDTGELRDDAIYEHLTLEADSFFSYMGDYMIDDKKHYHVKETITADIIKHIYE